MENKKTTELMSRKSTLKSKLMAAVSMLLVSAIMVSVTTYAWFILSTAPEVKGMSTTVGSNGALEMALVDYSTKGTTLDAVLNSIPTAVGSSSAKVSLKESNKTWGNLVDLSDDTAYGFGSMSKMYPARLNWTGTGADKTVNGRDLLKYAQYGTDGRVAELANATSGIYNGSAFVSDENTYGVRGIGKAVKQAELAGHLSSAKGSYDGQMTTAYNKAVDALNEAAQTIADIALMHALAAKEGAQESYTSAQVNTLNMALTKLEAATAEIKTALRWAVVAEKANGENGEKVELANVTDDMLSSSTAVGTYYAALTALNGKITTAKADTLFTKSGTSFTWKDIENVFETMVGSAKNIMLGGKTVEEVQKLYEQGGVVGWIIENGGVISVEISNGLFANVADFTKDIKSTKTVNVTVKGQKAESSVTAKKSIAGTAYLDELQAKVRAFKFEGEGNEDNFITEYYGYAVDLAFRSNAAGDLQLSGPKARVSSADQTADPALKGDGSTFTVESKLADVDAKAVAALRIVFLDTTSSKVIAVGKLGTATEETSKVVYPVNLYEFTVADNGALEVNDAKPIKNNKILTLEQNKAVALTAVVYMDGDATEYAQQELKGKLNLQFATSADLQPMQYSDYAMAPLTLDPTAVTAQVSQAEAVKVPTVTMNGKTITSGVTWKAEDGKTNVATVNENTGAVTLMGAGEVIITATYKDGSGTHTGSYTLKVS